MLRAATSFFGGALAVALVYQCLIWPLRVPQVLAWLISILVNAGLSVRMRRRFPDTRGGFMLGVGGIALLFAILMGNMGIATG